jgi:hypothetical protein
MTAISGPINRASHAANTKHLVTELVDRVLAETAEQAGTPHRTSHEQDPRLELSTVSEKE